MKNAENSSIFAPHFDSVFSSYGSIHSTVIDKIRQIILMAHFMEQDQKIHHKVSEWKSTKTKWYTTWCIQGTQWNKFYLADPVLQSFLAWPIWLWQITPMPGVYCTKKGNIYDPNKWRGIFLMEIDNKIYSRIICKQLGNTM